MPASRDIARSFLASLFPPALSAGLGFFSFWCRANNRYAFASVDDLDAAADLVIQLEPKDVHVGVGLRREIPERGRGKENSISAICGYWADIDVRSPSHPEQSRPPDYDEAAKIVDELAMPPTLVVDSGFGLHVWWLFDKPLLVTEENRLTVTARSDSFGAALQSAGARRGWQVDKVSDITRVLRIPGTFNRKTDPKSVLLLLDDGPRYSPDAPIPNLGQVIKEKVPKAPLLDLEVVPQAPLDIEDVKSRFGNLQRTELRMAARRVLKGEIFAPHGKREVMLRDLCGALGRIAAWNDPIELATIFEPSFKLLIEMFPEQHAQSVEELLYMAVDRIDRAQKKQRPQLAQDIAELERYKELARRQTLTDFPPPGVVEEAGARLAAGDDYPGGIYSDEHIAAFAAAAKCTPEAFRRRWVIQRGKIYYVFVNGDYRKGKTREELENCIEDMLGPAGDRVRFWYMKPDGSRKRIPLTEVLKDIVTVCDEVQVDMTIDRSYYDASSKTFHERVCPKRPLEPKYDGQIDKWLRLLGGSEAEKLLDWVATVTRLDLQTAALYLAGPSGAGKSMFVHGLSRIWTERGPVEIGRIVDNFNADLLTCPIMWADEEVPIPKTGTMSAFIRTIIGNDSRTISRKFMENSPLVGAHRMVLCANNDEILSTGDSVLSFTDLDAIATRILFIEVSKEPAEYLSSLGGRRGTTDWVTGDKIAAHALWLAANRQVVPGERFLVSGFETKMHRKLVIQGRIAAKCIEWLARFLDEPIPTIWKPKDAKGNVPLIVLGDDKYLVNTAALTDNWKMRIKTDYVPPSTTLVGRALANLSTGPEAVGTLKYHNIRVGQVLDWAEQHQIGDIDRMRWNLAAPVKADKKTSGIPEPKPFTVESLGVITGGKDKETKK